MDWTLVLDRALWLALGVALGLFLGYARWARRDAAQALDKVEKLDHEMHTDKELPHDA